MAQHRGRHAGGRAEDVTWAGLRAGGRLRRGVMGAAAAVVALVALTASQVRGDGSGHGDTAEVTAERGDVSAAPRVARGGGPSRAGGPPGDGYYHTELPPARSAESGGLPSGVSGAGGAESGIPVTVLDAYRKTARLLGAEEPGCGVRWELLAAVGKVESGQARGGALDEDGSTVRPLLGPVLNGAGVVRVADTDGGKWDGDAEFDRAVGPLQILPSMWAKWGADANGDGRREPGNIFDAVLTAGRFLCAEDRDLTSKAGRDAAVLAFNDSRAYLRTVISWAEFYRAEAREVPDGSGPLPTSPGAGAEDGGVSAERSGQPSAATLPSAEAEATPVTKPAASSPPPSPVPDRTVPGTPAPVIPAAVRRLGEARMTAAVGESFAEAARVRVVDERGRPVAGVRVRYAVVGDTGARFAGAAQRATVATGRNGTAVAPVLAAGATAGAFSLEVSVGGRDVPAAEFACAVQEVPVPADTLARMEQEPLTARPEGVFAGPLRVRATREGEAAEGAPVSAEMVSEDGPSFVGDEGEPVRSLPDLRTGPDGVLTLPEMRAGSRQGSFHMLLTTAGGARLTVGLTVSAA